MVGGTRPADSTSQAGGVQAAQRLVKGDDVSDLGVICEEADDGVAAEHVLGEALERFLRADFDHHACTFAIQRVQPGDELHR